MGDSPDELVQCPFNKDHIVIRRRFVRHLMKCRKNHPNHNMVVCPYNATEYVERSEFPNHLLKCKYKKSRVECEIRDHNILKNKLHGDLSDAPFHYVDLKSTNENNEFWDEESKDLDDQAKVPKFQHTYNNDWSTYLLNRGINIKSLGRGKILEMHLEFRNKREINNLSSSTKTEMTGRGLHNDLKEHERGILSNEGFTKDLNQYGRGVVYNESLPTDMKSCGRGQRLEALIKKKLINQMKRRSLWAYYKYEHLIDLNKILKQFYHEWWLTMWIH
uniref:CHHC U11-48K-type domain-containing protein n=1 Tax=Clastoptera arizonana TaxID=38151 RepID=A0A1B6C1I7_9HEMI